MTPRLGSYNPRKVIRTFRRAGWEITHHTGSHAIMTKPGEENTLSIPDHKGKDVKRGTLRRLIKDAGLTVDEFLRLI